MREAVGGSLLMYGIIPLIIIFIIFMSFVYRYATAFRIANTCVSQIESCQGTDCKSGCDIQNIATGYSEPKIEYVSLGNGKCMARVTVGVNFDIPFSGEKPVFNVSVESKAMHNSNC